MTTTAKMLSPSNNRPRSGKLERIASTNQLYETRTRSTLSFDVTGETEASAASGKEKLSKGPFESADSNEATNAVVSSQQGTTSTSRNPLARLSRKLFAAKASENQSSSDDSAITSQTETATESSNASPSTISRKSFRLPFTRPGSTDSAGDGSASPSRRSVKLFLPRVASKLRNTTNATAKDEDEGPPREESPKKTTEDERAKATSSLANRSPSRRLGASRLAVGGRKAESTDQDVERVTSGDSSPTTPQRISRRLFSPRKSTSGKRPEEVFGSVDPELLALFQQVTDDRLMRDQLAARLLALLIEGGSTKVRFVAAVNEYERTSGKSEKSALGKKIVSTFIQRDASFPLAGITIEDEDMGLESLPLIRATVTVELLSNPVVIGAVKEIAADHEQEDEDAH